MPFIVDMGRYGPFIVANCFAIEIEIEYLCSMTEHWDCFLFLSMICVVQFLKVTGDVGNLMFVVLALVWTISNLVSSVSNDELDPLLVLGIRNRLLYGPRFWCVWISQNFYHGPSFSMSAVKGSSICLLLTMLCLKSKLRFYLTVTVKAYQIYIFCRVYFFFFYSYYV